ncbi:hypothetical protein CYMTET_40285 [Cymbomonas tetramitiformis]|uniref:PIH1D1/2/3 CS-like domain-containing protein n=1 Tax=Cymbomonas tetramitiformis TaxID=36881 RepID=A0AAE0C9R5_9CHLO|nr:hypothetical protein CYMTET_40285 [Cymbomonas tetramitiformis]
MNFNFGEFEALNNLLEVGDAAQEEAAGANIGAVTPASFGAPIKPGAAGRLAAPKGRKDPKAIWDPDEVLNAIDDDVDDGRIRPTYEFLYRQAVGTEDAFLGLSGKDPSSADCEEMILRVELPGTNSMADLDLDVQASNIRLESPIYKLAMYLPHKVNDEKGTAKWDKKKETLSIIMPIVREDPF